LNITVSPDWRPSILIVYLYGRPHSPSNVASQILPAAASDLSSMLQSSCLHLAFSMGVPVAGSYAPQSPVQGPTISGILGGPLAFLPCASTAENAMAKMKSDTRLERSMAKSPQLKDERSLALIIGRGAGIFKRSSECFSSSQFTASRKFC